MTNTQTALIVTADGTDSKVEPTDLGIENLQRIVGGYVELISAPDFDLVALVNEDGSIHKLPPNAVASLIFSRPIFGTAVIVAESAIQ